MDEELESLREQSTRASTVYDDLEGEPVSESSGGFFSQLTGGQKLILALLLFVNVAALFCVVLAWTGNLSGLF